MTCARVDAVAVFVHPEGGSSKAAKYTVRILGGCSFDFAIYFLPFVPRSVVPAVWCWKARGIMDIGIDQKDLLYSELKQISTFHNFPWMYLLCTI